MHKFVEKIAWWLLKPVQYCNQETSYYFNRLLTVLQIFTPATYKSNLINLLNLFYTSNPNKIILNILIPNNQHD